MRRVPIRPLPACLLPACLLLASLVFLAPPAQGGEPEAAPGAVVAKVPAAAGPSTDDLLLLALSDVPTERTFAAQYLQHADRKTVLAVFAALRERMGLAQDEEPESIQALTRRRFLESRQAARPQPRILHTETWIVTLSPARRARLLKQVGITLGDDGAILDEGGARAFRDAVRADATIHMRCAPRLSMRDGKPASLTLEDQVSYVRAYREVQARGGTVVADPEVDTLTRGVVLRLQGQRMKDGEAVAMEVRATWADVPLPLAAFHRRPGAARAEVAIQVPRPNLTLLRASVAVPDGQYVLLAGPRRPSGEATLLLLHVLSQAPMGLPVPPQAGPPQAAPQPGAKRSPDKRMVTLEARVIEVDVEAAATLLAGARPTAKQHVVALDGAAAKALLARITGEARARIVSAPRITSYVGQKANVSILEQTAYVQDYEVEQRTGSQVATPIVGTLNEGIVLDVTARIAAAGGGIDLDFVASQAVIQRPIPEVQAEVAGKKVTIQTPEIQVRKVAVQATLPDGGWILVGDGTVFEPKKGGHVERFVLLRAAVATPEDAAAVKQAAPPKKR